MLSLKEQFEKIEERIRETGIRRCTSNTYLNNLSRYFKLFHKDLKNYDLVEFISENASLIVKNIREFYKKLTTQKSHISSWIKISNVLNLKREEKIFRDAFQIIRKLIEEERKTDENLLTKKINWVSFDMLKQAYNLQLERLKIYNLKATSSADPRFPTGKLPKKIFEILENALMMSLYLSDIENNPPRRIADYQKVYVINKKSHCDKKFKSRDHLNDDTNILYTKGMTWEFRTYKTSDKYGTILKSVGLKMKPILRLYLRWKNNNYGWLFNNEDGTRWSSSKFSSKMVKCWKQYYPNKNISINMLRNIIFSHKFRNVPQMDEIKEYARQAGTSAGTLFEYYKQELDCNGQMI